MKAPVGGLGRKFSVQEPNPYFASELKEDLQRTQIIVMSSDSNLQKFPRSLPRASLPNSRQLRRHAPNRNSPSMGCNCTSADALRRRSRHHACYQERLD